MNDTAASTPVADAGPSWESASAEFLGTPAAAPGTPGAAAPAAEPAVDPWEEQLPKPVIRSAAERIAAKHAAAAERAKFVPVEQQLQAERARVSQLTASQAEAETKFQALMAAGDIDGALKVKGFSQSFFDLQRQMLQAKGALPPSDPRYDKLAAELAHEREQRQQLVRQQQEQQSRAQAEQQRLQDIADVKAELAASSLPHAAIFAEAPGVSEAVTRALVDNPGLTTTQAAAMVRNDYAELYKSMRKLDAFFGNQPASPAENLPGSGARASHTAIPVSGGAAPVLGLPDNLSPDEAWAASVKMFFGSD